MAAVIREVNLPYTVNPNDEAIGHDIIFIQRAGETVAVVLPYAEYVALTQQAQTRSLSTFDDLSVFDRERAAFRRMLPELLKAHKGKWAAIIGDEMVDLGEDRPSVVARVRARYGFRPIYVREILERPRVYKIESPRVARKVE